MVSLDTPKMAHPKAYGLENVSEPQNCYKVINGLLLFF